MSTVLAFIGLLVVARFLFTLLFPVTSMKIRLAFLIRSMVKLAEHQADRVEGATHTRPRS